MSTPTMTKYRTNKYSIEIEPIEVTRETEASVYVSRTSYSGACKEQRTAKVSTWHRFFDTEAEARTFLIEREERHLHSLRTQTKVAEERLHALRNGLN